MYSIGECIVLHITKQSKKIVAKKIAMLFPYTPSYREAIYKLMDKELEVDWFFCGNAKRNLKLFDYSLLNHCNLSMKECKIWGPIIYYKGIRNLNLQQYDVIICAGVIRCISEWWLLQKLGRGMKKPKIYLWTHGWYGKETYLQKLIKKFFFRKVDGFFLYGEYARNEMLNEGFEVSKLHVIKNSLDYDKQLELRNSITGSDVYRKHFKNDFPSIIFIGRLTVVKKLNLLIKAVSLLKQKGECYNIVFVGDGEMRQNLEEMVAKEDLTYNVWFYGACFDENVNAQLVYNADLCVAPGNIGLTAMHVMMFGCPAVSHNNFKWQMPEFESIKPGETGDFFEYDNVEDLARCISEWFRSKKDCREKVREACYKEIDNYWNPHYQLNLLKRILEDK